MNFKKAIKPGIIIIVIAAIVYVAAFSDARQYLSVEFLEGKIAALGFFGPIAFIGLYTVATVAFLPASPLTIIGGLLFGPLQGTLWVLLGATVGATLAFLISRYLARDYALSLLKKFPKIKHYDDKLEENGFVTMLILRLVPLFPFNALNFVLGVTKISFKDYFLGTFLGMIPGTFAYVYIGSIIRTLTASGEHWTVIFQDPILYIFIVVFAGIIYFPKYYNKKQKEKKESTKS